MTERAIRRVLCREGDGVTADSDVTSSPLSKQRVATPKMEQRAWRGLAQGHLSPATTDEPATNVWWDGAGAWDVLLGCWLCLAAKREDRVRLFLG